MAPSSSSTKASPTVTPSAPSHVSSREIRGIQDWQSGAFHTARPTTSTQRLSASSASSRIILKSAAAWTSPASTAKRSTTAATGLAAHLARLFHRANAGTRPRFPRPVLVQADPTIWQDGDGRRASAVRGLAFVVQLAVAELEFVSVTRPDEEAKSHGAAFVPRPDEAILFVVLEHRCCAGLSRLRFLASAAENASLERHVSRVHRCHCSAYSALVGKLASSNA